MKELNIDCLEGLRVNHELNQALYKCIEYRKKNFTQEHIAKRTGKSVSTVKRFEQGRVDSLFLLCFYLEFLHDKELVLLP